jgi:hypothetical protein
MTTLIIGLSATIRPLFMREGLPQAVPVAGAGPLYPDYDHPGDREHPDALVECYRDGVPVYTHRLMGHGRQARAEAMAASWTAGASWTEAYR